MSTSIEKTRILVTDDDTVVLATISQGLRAAGYEVAEASSGEEAIQMAIEQPADVAIMDIRMPGISGIDAVKRMAKQTSMPVIFLSAYDDKELVDQALQEGAFGYLIKPVSVARIIPAIEAAIRRGRDMQRLTEAVSAGESMHMAVGVIMERYSLSSKSAFEVLRRHARSQRRKIRSVAVELLKASDSLNALPVKEALGRRG